MPLKNWGCLGEGFVKWGGFCWTGFFGLRDELGDLFFAFGAEAGGDALAVWSGAVLAHLAFAVELRDGHAKADDAAKLTADEVCGGVGHAPGRGSVVFVAAGE